MRKYESRELRDVERSRAGGGRHRLEDSRRSSGARPRGTRAARQNTVTNRRSAAAPARKRGCSCYAVASACAFETGVRCGPKVAAENASKSGSGLRLQGSCDTREPVGSASGVQKLCTVVLVVVLSCVENRVSEARASQLVRDPYGSTELPRAGVVVVRRRRRRSARVGRPVSDPSLNVVCTPLPQRRARGYRWPSRGAPACCGSVLRQAPRPPRSNTGSAAGAALKVASVGKKQATLPSVRLREQAPRFYRRVRGAQLPRKGARRVGWGPDPHPPTPKSWSMDPPCATPARPDQKIPHTEG